MCSPRAPASPCAWKLPRGITQVLPYRGDTKALHRKPQEGGRHQYLKATHPLCSQPSPAALQRGSQDTAQHGAQPTPKGGPAAAQLQPRLPFKSCKSREGRALRARTPGRELAMCPMEEGEACRQRRHAPCRQPHAAWERWLVLSQLQLLLPQPGYCPPCSHPSCRERP